MPPGEIVTEDGGNTAGSQPVAVASTFKIGYNCKTLNLIVGVKSERLGFGQADEVGSLEVEALFEPDEFELEYPVCDDELGGTTNRPISFFEMLF